jgi:hypothetical protein
VQQHGTEKRINQFVIEKEFKLNIIRRFTVYAAAVALLSGLAGCTLLGAGIGAVAGSGTAVGVAGGAVIGGVVAYEITK